MGYKDDEYKALSGKIEDLKDSYHEVDKKLDITLTRLEDHFKDDSKNLENLTLLLQGINDTMKAQAETLRGQADQIEIHVQGVIEAHKRNDLLEQQISMYKQDMEARLTKVEAPWNWLSQTTNVLKFVAATASAAAAITIVVKWLSKIL